MISEKYSCVYSYGMPNLSSSSSSSSSLPSSPSPPPPPSSSLPSSSIVFIELGHALIYGRIRAKSSFQSQDEDDYYYDYGRKVFLCVFLWHTQSIIVIVIVTALITITILTTTIIIMAIIIAITINWIYWIRARPNLYLPGTPQRVPVAGAAWGRGPVPWPPRQRTVFFSYKLMWKYIVFAMGGLHFKEWGRESRDMSKKLE